MDADELGVVADALDQIDEAERLKHASLDATQFDATGEVQQCQEQNNHHQQEKERQSILARLQQIEERLAMAMATELPPPLDDVVCQ